MLKRNQLEVLLNLQLLASGVPLKAMTAVQAGFMGKARLLNLGVVEKRHSPIEDHPIFIGNFGMLYQLYPILVQTVASLHTLLQVLSLTLLHPNALSIPFLCHWQVAVGTLLASPVVMFLGMGTGYWLHKDGNPWPFCASIQSVVSWESCWRDWYTMNRSQEAWCNSICFMRKCVIIRPCTYPTNENQHHSGQNSKSIHECYHITRLQQLQLFINRFNLILTSQESQQLLRNIDPPPAVPLEPAPAPAPAVPAPPVPPVTPTATEALRILAEFLNASRWAGGDRSTFFLSHKE